MKIKNFSVRPMEYNDIKTVSDLWNKLSYNQLSRDEYYNKNPDNLLKVDNTGYFKNSFENPNCSIFIAEYEHNIVGFSEMWFYEKDFFFNIEDYAYVLHLFVDTAIKVGINPLLIPFELCKACEEKALDCGYRYIGGDVFEFNNQMKTFLQFLEYQPYRTRYMKKLYRNIEQGDKKTYG